MTNTFNLGKDTLYTIECPNGVIGFDLEDHTNIDRLKKMYDIIDKEDKRFKSESLLIEKRNNTKKDKYGITGRETEELKNYNSYINKTTEAINLFFGEGATDKIFYDNVLNRVTITMTRLEVFMLDLLPEHLEKANIKQNEYMAERLKKRGRFNKADSDVIDLDEEATE